MKCSVTRFKVHRNAPTDVQAVRASKETPVTPNQSMTAHRKRRKGTSKPSRREAGADAKTKSSLVAWQLYSPQLAALHPFSPKLTALQPSSPQVHFRPVLQLATLQPSSPQLASLGRGGGEAEGVKASQKIDGSRPTQEENNTNMAVWAVPGAATFWN